MSGENDKVVNRFVVRPMPDGGVFVLHMESDGTEAHRLVKTVDPAMTYAEKWCECADLRDRLGDIREDIILIEETLESVRMMFNQMSYGGCTKVKWDLFKTLVSLQEKLHTELNALKVKEEDILFDMNRL